LGGGTFHVHRLVSGEERIKNTSRGAVLDLDSVLNHLCWIAKDNRLEMLSRIYYVYSGGGF